MRSDDWRPSAAIDTLKKRHALIQRIRSFFLQRDYLEVDTPSMGRYGGTDVYLDNIPALFRGKRYALQTSPEYHMKRLLAAGSGPIFQLSKAFRDDESGRWHNPEFTLLEWYQLEIDHFQLMDEVEIFLKTILHCGPLQRLTYQELFLRFCQLDPFTASLEDLQKKALNIGCADVLSSSSDRDAYLFLLIAELIEPQLKHIEHPIAVYHFPASQSALAKVEAGVAQRFEIYYKGVELANGFHELTDSTAQRQRFHDDNRSRRTKGLKEVAMDERFLAALSAGLPSCSGVALGVDRLLAMALGYDSLQPVMAFPIAIA
jgi:elongation factor P--(R)-beta-lysine ligase